MSANDDHIWLVIDRQGTDVSLKSQLLSVCFNKMYLNTMLNVYNVSEFIRILN